MTLRDDREPKVVDLNRQKGIKAVNMDASTTDTFDVWLTDKLLSVNTEVDTEVFVSYIISILESEPPNDLTIESIQEFLEEIKPEEDVDLLTICRSIVFKWTEMEQIKNNSKAMENDIIEKKMQGIVHQQQHQPVKNKELSKEDKERKAAILAMYSAMSDDEGNSDTEGAEGKGTKNAENALVKNMNTQMVLDREREKKEKSKADAEAKKQKDKEDREKQKQKAAERKEHEKKRTQKVEKRR